jgi:predicted regulator of Ras-like GTPase activity (Roadblock/LC7/MglB family)
MTDLRAQAEGLLDALVGKGLLGAGLVGRDGLPLMLRFPRPVQQETFSAMTAALLGASEAALLELAESSPATVTIEAGRLRVAVAGVDDTHLLVVAAPSTLEPARLAQVVADGVAKLRALLGA